MEIDATRLILVLKDRGERNGALGWRKWLWRRRLRKDRATRPKARAASLKESQRDVVQDPPKASVL